jgi:hypothetical protein
MNYFDVDEISTLVAFGVGLVVEVGVVERLVHVADHVDQVSNHLCFGPSVIEMQRLWIGEN